MEADKVKEIVSIQREYLYKLLESNLDGKMASASYYIEFINKLQSLIE